MGVHQVVLAGKKSSVLNADFSMGAGYDTIEIGALTSVILTVKTDGTWTITKDAGGTLSGTPTSGTWRTGGVGANHEVLFATANPINSPVIGNDAAAYTALSANRAISVSKTNATASADVTVSIRRIGTTSPVETDTSTFTADGSP